MVAAGAYLASPTIRGGDFSGRLDRFQVPPAGRGGHDFVPAIPQQAL